MQGPPRSVFIGESVSGQLSAKCIFQTTPWQRLDPRKPETDAAFLLLLDLLEAVGSSNSSMPGDGDFQELLSTSLKEVRSSLEVFECSDMIPYNLVLEPNAY